MAKTTFGTIWRKTLLSIMTIASLLLLFCVPEEKASGNGTMSEFILALLVTKIGAAVFAITAIWLYSVWEKKQLI